ncbi:tRNA G46 methylase TrmB [Idiomarina fontislapidosi]|uniref:tRNA (guanine(46)-N(7))-methyltransferase n=1 Tax=Idiomarina fontislapidosi TaxID=263723 RepID=A0A432Y827_9GAMM|nr:SAM-dependent methyltransferase [Idiomarina fontislapidosi]PYE33731.1 tRNA G46 methylase TrmB [Idiomarina fontislapidosi]RUO57130.1 SAM-dependent methyltransferase [Idiomarina fontislapidosi]
MSHEARPVHSNQTGPHEDTLGVALRHWQSTFLKPIQAHNQAAFDAVNERVQAWQGPVILDSCCGVGESTAKLAEQHPEALVIGVDKSSHRLDKHDFYEASSRGQRYYLVRADLLDFWRLVADAKWRVELHTILYPNPWPKQAHLARRWHGSPVWPAVVQIGGQLQMRSNWSTYLLEVSQALSLNQVDAQVSYLGIDSAQAMTPFERKYLASGQALWRLTADLTTAVTAVENVNR